MVNICQNLVAVKLACVAIQHWPQNNIGIEIRIESSFLGFLFRASGY